jgi:hypothetical protein
MYKKINKKLHIYVKYYYIAQNIHVQNVNIEDIIKIEPEKYCQEPNGRPL